MNDAREHFRPLDSIEPPDRWPEVERRVASAPDSVSPRRRAVRTVGLVAATVAMTTGLVGVLVFAFRPSPQEPSPAQSEVVSPTSTELSAEGTSFILPDGWYGRADALPGYTHRIIQVATFALPPLADIEASEARASLNPDDILIVLNEFSSLCPPCPSESEGLPVVITPEDLLGAHEVPKWLPPLDVPGASLARRIFRVGHRYFDLTVEFGTDPSNVELDRANEVIGSLDIGEWVPEPNGSCQWNEIGMLDPDCPQPHWLREVLSRAGFQIGGQGSTFVGRKGGTEFFVSVAEVDEVSNDHLALLEDPRAYPVKEDVDGITVYGSDLAWEWFTEEMQVRIGAGPDGDSQLPNIQQLTPLIEASLAVPYPPPVGE